MMSRTTTRLTATGLLTLTAAATGLVLAPIASAAEAPAVTVSATNVAPGEEFSVSGADCLSEEVGYEPLVGVMSENGDVEEYVEPALDGSWSVTTAFPEDMAGGDQLLVAYCDSSYNGGF